MSLEVVKKFAEESGNDDFLNAVKSLEGSMAANLDRMSYLEKENQTNIAKRDKAKSVSELVKTKLGLEEITEEALSNLLKSKTDGTAEFDNEKRKLESMLAELKAEKESIGSKYQETVNMHSIERSLNDLGASKETNGSVAYDILMKEVVKGSEFIDGAIVFKANDGTTIRNADGTPMSLSDRYNQIKDSQEFKFLFVESKPKSGSGSQSTTKSSQSVSGNLSGDKSERVQALKARFPELN